MVLLPLPLSPTSATISRSPMTKLASSTACSVLRAERAADLEMPGEAACFEQRRAAVGQRPVTASPLARAAGSGRAPRRRRTAAGSVARSSGRSADGHRGPNRQPPAGGRGRADCPGCRSAARVGRGSTGTPRASPCCTGWAGVSKTARVAPTSTTCPAYITSSAVGEVADERHVVGDEDDRESELPLQVLDLHHQRTLRDDVERRGRLVHDHQIRVRTAAPSRSSTRWRMPPLSWCG